jgi:hypothetical protein
MVESRDLMSSADDLRSLLEGLEDRISSLLVRL